MMFASQSLLRVLLLVGQNSAQLGAACELTGPAGSSSRAVMLSCSLLFSFVLLLLQRSCWQLCFCTVPRIPPARDPGVFPAGLPHRCCAGEVRKLGFMCLGFLCPLLQLGDSLASWLCVTPSSTPPGASLPPSALGELLGVPSDNRYQMFTCLEMSSPGLHFLCLI